MASPFEILGVDPDADDEEIVRAYRKRVKEAHPDQGGSTRAFRRVQTAYERIQAGYDPDDPDDQATDQGVERERQQQTESRVEYLNYEVLTDHGWELTDENLFEKAARAGFAPEDHGQFVVEPTESLLEAAEKHGLVWPFACRGGACSNCAVLLYEGELPPPANHVLPPELIEKGIRLSCSVTPATPEVKVVYNVKHLPGVNELLLPATRFRKASSDD